MKNFLKNEKGSISILVAVILPVLLLIGLGMVDLAAVTSQKKSHLNIADASVLSGGAIPNFKNRNFGPSEIRKIVDDHFVSMSELNELPIDNYSITVDERGGLYNIQLCYSSKAKLHSSKLTGLGLFSYSDCSEATVAPPKYLEIHFVIDASGSMGVGASKKDHQKMVANSGCAFACHTVSEPVANCRNQQTTYCAAKIGAKTRFDVVKEAIEEVLEYSDNLSTVNNQFRFFVHKFSNFLTTVTPNDVSSGDALQAVKSLEMDKAGAGTNTTYSLNELRKALGANGSGNSPNDREIIVILLSDGVEGNVYEIETNGKFEGIWVPDTNFLINEPGFWFGQERSQAINFAGCNQIKQNYTLSIMQIEYLIPNANMNDARFRDIRKIINPVISDVMAECASDGNLFFKAESEEDIKRMSREMFENALTRTVLSR